METGHPFALQVQLTTAHCSCMQEAGVDAFQRSGVWNGPSHPHRRDSLWGLSWQCPSLPCSRHNRPSEIIWVSTCQAEAGPGCRDLLLKEDIFLTLLCRPLPCQGTPVLPQSVWYLSHPACVLPEVQACLLLRTGAKLDCGIFPAGPKVCCCQGNCGRVEE